MDPATFSQLQSNAEQAYAPPAPVSRAQTTTRKPGGVSGFLSGIAHSVVDPFISTGKALAYAPAAIGRELKNKPITDLQQKAFGTTNQGDIAKKIIGNTAQVGLTVAAPGANTIRKAAITGAATGASSALAQKGSTANDVLAGGLAGGATGGALGVAGKVIGKLAGKGGTKTTGGFLDGLTTQGQQMQGRGLGISGGNKVGSMELQPQDTARMLDTLKTEGIKTSNANSTARDLNTKLQGYGKQIADHFKVNDAPLKPEDTKVIGDNFIQGLKTTDPSVLKQADILNNDLQKNVKSTKDLWEFRKTLDSRIPDSKFMDAATTAKVTALKEMRSYVSNELGTVPGMSNYHALSEIKPFLGKGMRELNQPSGGIVGRVLSSGPIQKGEALLGKGVEAIGNKGGDINAPTIPVKTPTIPAPIKSFARGALRQGATAEAGGAMVPGQDQTQPQTQPLPNASTGLLDNGADTSGAAQPQDTSPFAPANIQENMQKILAQGGTMKDVSEYLANAKAYNDLTGATGGAKKPISATAADAIANANAGLQSLSTLEQELTNNPSVQQKSAASQIANPFGITSRLAGTGKYDAALSQAKDVIARLRTGAAISNSEEKRFTAMLPQPADSQEVVTQKLNLLKNALNTIVQRVGGNSSDLLQEAAQAAQ